MDANRYKRCIECDQVGHFKCRNESRSNLLQLSFNVGYDLDEFFRKKKKSDSKVATADLEASSAESEGDDSAAEGKKSKRKRDEKRKNKK